MTTVTEEINAWIKEHRSERDALNIALSRLRIAQFKLDELREAIPWKDCPQCAGIIIEGWTCTNCGFDNSA